MNCCGHTCRQYHQARSETCADDTSRDGIVGKERSSSRCRQPGLLLAHDASTDKNASGCLTSEAVGRPPVNMSKEKSRAQGIFASRQTLRHEKDEKNVDYRHTTKVCIYVRDDQVYVHAAAIAQPMIDNASNRGYNHAPSFPDEHRQ